PHSNFPLPPPPPLRPVRIRRPLQPPLRGLPPRQPRCRHRLQGRRHEHPPGHLLLHLLHHQDRRRPLRLRLPLGPAPAHHQQQRRLPRHPPPDLGHQDQLLAA